MPPWMKLGQALLLLPMTSNQELTKKPAPEHAEIQSTGARPAAEIGRADVLALFRLLMREPPTDHDFKSCPICKRYGITAI
jgi:hypothetical protein